MVELSLVLSQVIDSLWVFGALLLTIVLCATIICIQNWWEDYKFKREQLKTDPPSKYQVALEQTQGRCK